MDSEASPAESIILRLVRGDLPLSASVWAGVVVEEDGNKGWTIAVSSPLIVRPSATDVAIGIAGYLPKGTQLRDWATFVLGASNVLSLERLESESGGEALLGALWDAAFRGVLRPEQVSEVRRLTAARGT